MLPKSLAFVDVETTGTNPRFNRIIEVGVLRVENNEIVSTYQTLINPGTYLPPDITRITGIRSEDLIDAPPFAEIRQTLREYLEDAVLVAHNARFDYGFLRFEFARLAETFTSKQFCTLKMARLLFPKLPRHNLDTLIQHFQIPCENRHRALDDATAMFHFFKKAMGQTSTELFNNAVKNILKRVSLPIHLSEDDLKLPESPGVYIFYGENDVPLYIGKSNSIRDRVLSHFSADISSPTEMKISQQVKRIETRQTPGQLGALFLESSLIKTMLPLYNKRLRQSRKMILLKKEMDKNGYDCITRVPFVNGDVLQDFTSIVGICKSDRAASDFLYTIAKDHSLCPKMLKLEKTSSSCFYYRLGYCKGACVNKEPSLTYNMRMIMAFSKSKIMPWPFKGPVAIVEEGIDGSTEHMLVDNWCYIKSIKTDTEGNTREESSPTGFDVDTYKIMRSFLLNKQKGTKIKNLTSQDLNDHLQQTLSVS